MSGDEDGTDTTATDEEDGERIEYGLEEFGTTTGDDVTAAGESADAADERPEWSGGTVGDVETETTPAEGGADDDPLLDPEGLVDDTLTTVVGAVAGVFIGFVTFVTVILTTDSVGFGAALGLVAWLGGTGHLVRRHSVLGAVSRGAYGVALVLFLVPLVMLGPNVEGGDLAGRVVGFLLLLGVVAVPAAFVAGVGYVVSRFAPEPEPEPEPATANSGTDG